MSITVAKGVVGPIQTDVRRARSRAVADAMAALGIDPNSMTDPASIRAVLADMKLDDFVPTYKPMRDFLAQVKAAPQSLKPFIDSVRTGLAEDNPAIAEFLAKAVENKWLSPGPAVQSSLQRAFIVEALTVAMANNVDFSAELNAHIMAKRRQYGFDTSSDLSTFVNAWKATGSIFEAVKLISIDPVLKYMDVIRKLNGDSQNTARIEELESSDPAMTSLGRFGLNPEHHKKPTFAPLKINIAEAAATEFSDGYEDNALVAEVLNQDADKHLGQSYSKGPVLDTAGTRSPKPISVVHAAATKEQGYFPHDKLPDDWARLYETWNAAFVLSKFDDLDVVLPKLLVPSVLNAPGDTYLGTRILALWLTMNTLLFRSLDQTPSQAAPDNRRVMAQSWGGINKRYALEFAQRHLSKSAQVIKDEFEAGNVAGTRLVPLVTEVSKFVLGD